MDPSRQNGGAVANGGARGDVSRADRFEDEKRRIIETCFNKEDGDGSGMCPPSLQSSVFPPSLWRLPRETPQCCPCPSGPA